MLRRSLTLLTLALLCSSCITTALWNGSMEPDADGVEHATLGSEKRNYGWIGFGWRALLTPFTIVLDGCTYPLQAVWFGWDEDDDC